MALETLKRISECFNKAETGPVGMIFDMPGGQAFLYLQKAPAKESENEDSAGIFVLDDGDVVLAIADGMGGMPGGSKASGIVVSALQEGLSESFRGRSDHREDILNSIESANENVLALGIGAASTVVVAEISGKTIRPYHAGDSELLLVGQKGKVKLQTISHSPVGYGVESGLIDQEDAIFHDERHLVSNYLGNQNLRIEIGPAVSMSPLDTLLVASDGVFDNLYLEELVTTIRTGRLQRAGEQLIELVTKRMLSGTGPCKPDDVGFILYRRD